MTILAMIAFAANSLLCRLALGDEHIDPASFTAIRLLSGAVTLGLVVLVGRRSQSGDGNWPSAVALITYAACFSFAYVTLSTATGALLLFGAVQTTMFTAAVVRGERLTRRQAGGLALALAGLGALLIPGATAPSLVGASLMASAGIAWGIYSLRGRGDQDPIRATAGNFARAAPMALALAAVWSFRASFDSAGVWYAIASGALASGAGYAIWYSAIAELKTTTASVSQLSVPVLAAIGGAMFRAEPITARWTLCSATILLGIGVVVVGKATVSGMGARNGT